MERPRKAAESQIVQVIRQGHSFLVCSHMNPDGDAVGSSVAMALFLESEGKDVVIYNQDPITALYGFCPGAERIQQTIPEEKRFDFSFLLDCASPQRVGEPFEHFSNKGQLVIIDHHPLVHPINGLHLIRTEAAATGELLYDVMRAYGAPLTPQIATALYMALMTDTGSFRFSNTTPRTLSIAAELLKIGAEHELLTDGLYERYPPERFKLLARVLQTLRFSLEGKVATLEVTRKMYDETGGHQDLTEGFVDIPRSINGVEVALLFREVAAEEYRVSLRSRDKVDVGSLASRFQGGGHQNAAGCTLHGKAVEVYGTILKAVKEALS